MNSQLGVMGSRWQRLDLFLSQRGGFNVCLRMWAVEFESLPASSPTPVTDLIVNLTQFRIIWGRISARGCLYWLRLWAGLWGMALVSWCSKIQPTVGGAPLRAGPWAMSKWKASELSPCVHFFSLLFDAMWLASPSSCLDVSTVVDCSLELG